jgi:hypothetical protein
MAEGKIVQEDEVTFEFEQRATDVDPYRARIRPAGEWVRAESKGAALADAATGLSPEQVEAALGPLWNAKMEADDD